MSLPRPVLLVTGFVVAAFGALWLQNAIVPLSAPFWGLFDNQLDLEVYRQGALTIAHGDDLYGTKMNLGLDYTYTPFSTILFAPFAWMSFDLAKLVWIIGIVVALYLVVLLSFRSLGRSVTWPLRIIAMSLVAVALLLEPVRTTIWYGQINVFLLLVVTADLTRPDGSRFKGIGTGVAAGIKLTPLLFAVYFAVQRNWRAFAGVVGGFVGTVVIGFLVLPRDSWTFWTGTMLESDRVGSAQLRGNQSIRGMLANQLHTDEPSTLLWLVLVLGALALGLFAAVCAHRHGQDLLAISIVGMTSCVVSPMSWGHHWVWFVPILVILLDRVMRSDAGRAVRAASAVGAAALFLVAFPWPTYAPGLDPAGYYTGLYVKSELPFQWFVISPYLWVFVVTAIVAIIVYRPVRGSTVGSAPSIAPGVAATVIAEGVVPQPVGDRGDAVGDIGDTVEGTEGSVVGTEEAADGSAGQPHPVRRRPRAWSKISRRKPASRLRAGDQRGRPDEQDGHDELVGTTDTAD